MKWYPGYWRGVRSEILQFYKGLKEVWYVGTFSEKLWTLVLFPLAILIFPAWVTITWYQIREPYSKVFIERL
jgi:hypothetical protein